MHSILTTSRTSASTFISCYFCDSVTVRLETDARYGDFSDVYMKQGFLRSEAFKLGEAAVNYARFSVLRLPPDHSPAFKSRIILKSAQPKMAHLGLR